MNELAKTFRWLSGRRDFLWRWLTAAGDLQALFDRTGKELINIRSTAHECHTGNVPDLFRLHKAVSF